MTGSFFKVAIRIFYKYRSYTLVNVFALAIGLASSIIIFLYVENEYSYDRFHRQCKRDIPDRHTRKCIRQQTEPCRYIGSVSPGPGKGDSLK